MKNAPVLPHNYMKFADGSTISWGPGDGFYGPGHNNGADSGGICSKNVKTNPEQDQKMKDWAKQGSRNQMSKAKVFRIVYLGVGLAVIVLAYISKDHIGMEAMVGPMWLLIAMGLPLTFLVEILFETLLRDLVSGAAAIVPMLIVLGVGYFQWFVLMPIVVSKFKNRKTNR